MPAKRIATSQTGPATKKARNDPVQKNIQTIVKALNDDTVIIPGPDSCREMLIFVAPAALTSPSNERHENQSKVIDILKEAFEADRATQQAAVDEKQQLVDSASGEKAEKVAIKEEAEGKLKAHKAETQEKKQELSKAEQVVDESKEYLKRAKQAQAKAVKKHAEVEEEQTHLSAVHESFKALKEGACDDPKDTKKNIASIVSVLKDIQVEEALIKSLPQALSHSPADRGHFDQLTVQQVETTLDDHIKTFEEKVAASQLMINEHEVAVVASEAVVELAAEKQSTCEKVIEEADLVQEKLVADITAARAVVTEHTKVVRQRNHGLGEVQVRLSMVTDVLSAITFLETRVAEPPAEPAVDEAVMEIESAMKVPSPARGSAIPAF
jgi:DNA repair exonuclease SbcCD ATPase subunit